MKIEEEKLQKILNKINEEDLEEEQIQELLKGIDEKQMYWILLGLDRSDPAEEELKKIFEQYVREEMAILDEREIPEVFNRNKEDRLQTLLGKRHRLKDGKKTEHGEWDHAGRVKIAKNGEIRTEIEGADHESGEAIAQDIEMGEEAERVERELGEEIAQDVEKRGEAERSDHESGEKNTQDVEKRGEAERSDHESGEKNTQDVEKRAEAERSECEAGTEDTSERKFRRFTVFRRSWKLVNVAAVLALVVLALVAVNGVSVMAFGVSPWGEVVRYFEKQNMKDVRLEEDDRENVEPVNDVPTYVPEGWEQKIFKRLKNDFIFILWKNEKRDEDIKIQYVRTNVEEGKKWTRYSIQNKIKTRRNVKIKKFKGEVIENKNMSMIVWKDSLYSYSIAYKKNSINKGEILEMAESIYKK